MFKSYIDYGAIATKVRAMCGALLKRDELEEIYRQRTVDDICAYLRQCPGYAEALSQVTPEDGMEGLVTALREDISGEYDRLYNFGSSVNKQLFKPTIYRTELHAILSALGRLGAGSGTVYKAFAYKEPLAKKSDSDVFAIECCEDFVTLRQTAEKTIYKEALNSLELNEDGNPDFAEASLTLARVYFRVSYTWLSTLDKGFSKKLLELNALELDLLCINSILRLHRSFPASLASARDHLFIPVRGRLRPALVDALIGALNEDEALGLLKDTPWEKYYSSGERLDLERTIEHAMESFCHRLITTSEPAPWFPQAYLTLREIERARLIRIITAVHYGLDLRTVFNAPEDAEESA